MAQSTPSSRQRRMPPGPARRAEQKTVLGVLLALSLGSLGGFAFLAYEVVTQALAASNAALELAFHAIANANYDAIALGLTTIGSVAVIALLGLLVIGAFLVKHRSVDAITLAAVLGGGAVLTEGLKHVFHVKRPELFQQIVVEHSYSFPSGHATMSFCLFGFLIGWLLLEGPRRVFNWVGALLCLALACAIAASRVYLGVHWPSDVVGGSLIATFWVTACLAGRQVALASRSEMAE